MFGSYQLKDDDKVLWGRFSFYLNAYKLAQPQIHHRTEIWEAPLNFIDIICHDQDVYNLLYANNAPTPALKYLSGLGFQLTKNSKQYRKVSMPPSFTIDRTLFPADYVDPAFWSAVPYWKSPLPRATTVTTQVGKPAPITTTAETQVPAPSTANAKTQVAPSTANVETQVETQEVVATSTGSLLTRYVKLNKKNPEINFKKQLLFIKYYLVR
jgi:hypothetical protein